MAAGGVTAPAHANGHGVPDGSQVVQRIVGEHVAAAVRRALDNYRARVEDPAAEDWPLETHLLEFGEALAEELAT